MAVVFHEVAQHSSLLQFHLHLNMRFMSPSTVQRKCLSHTHLCFQASVPHFFFQRSSGFIYLFIYLFIFSCVGSLFLCEDFLQLRQAGATLHRGARASHYCGLSCCGVEAPDIQAQQLWLTGLVSPRHVGSSQTRARTRVPCIGRQILNHCTTREAQSLTFKGPSMASNYFRHKPKYLTSLTRPTDMILAYVYYIGLSYFPP